MKTETEPTWVSDNGQVQLYLGDCLEVLPRLPAESVDAVLTDPPYFMPATHYQSQVKWQKKWADVTILQTWWDVVSHEFKRVLIPTGHMLAFCNANSFAAFYPPMYNLWDHLTSIVWDKDRPGLGRTWRHSHELIIAARDHAAYDPDDGKLRSDVIRCKATLSADRLHPVEKPAAMLAELIIACCPVGGVVLDAYIGSGTTGVACVQTGRRFIGIEIDPSYFEIAKRRIQDALAQPRLDGI